MAPQVGFPEPRVVDPLSGFHKQTFILLHGRGSSANKFEPPLLATPFPSSPSTPGDGSVSYSTLTQSFPHARFVIPSAPKGRASIYKRSVIRQWFNDWRLNHETELDELQISGLADTVVFLHGLIRHEVSLVPGGARNVILGGLSQGCAASMVALLLWDGEPLRAFVGMCGWLPYLKHLESIVRAEGGDEVSTLDSDGIQDDFASSHEPELDDFDPFERSPSPEIALESTHLRPDHCNPVESALRWLAEEIRLMRMSPCVSSTLLQDTAVFLGHGTDDEKVNIRRGRECSRFLSALGMDVSWKEYKSLGHWYSQEMLYDIVSLVQKSFKDISLPQSPVTNKKNLQ